MNDLQIAINDFINHCRLEKGLSSKTIKAYSIDLRQLSAYFISKQHCIELSHISKIELRGFLESISILKPKTIKRKVATLKSLFNYLEFDDKILLNPLRKMRIKIKEPHRLPKVMDIKEITSIFKFAYSKPEKIQEKKSYAYVEAIRNIVIIEILFATGARVSEVADLKMDNVDAKNGCVLIRGKGNKERLIQICNKESLNILKLYLKLKKENSHEYFFTNRFGNKISDQSIRAIVKKYSKGAGILKHITPHVFRHSFATLLLEKDVDIKYIQLLLGHSSLMTTQIYTHVNRIKQKQLLRNKHPRKDFLMTILASDE